MSNQAQNPNMKKRKIFILILIIAIITLAYFGYQIIASRYFKNAPNTIENEKKSPSSQEKEIKDEEFSKFSENEIGENENPEVENYQMDLDEKGSALASITNQHCNDNCKAFATDLDIFEYCEKVCGISPDKKVSNCDGEKEIQKDYCLKDLAVSKKDASICSKINDINVRKTCNNRLMEEILESQKSESFE